MPHIIPTKTASKTLYMVDLVWNGGKKIVTEALAWSDSPDTGDFVRCLCFSDSGASGCGRRLPIKVWAHQSVDTRR